jgi:RNA polymerase sigma factor (TIGR02999 family)
MKPSPSIHGVHDDVLEPEEYRRLRALAARVLGASGRHVTLTPTVLLHDAWLRLRGSGRRWNDTAHMRGALARAMRHVLVDRARSARARHRHVRVTTSLLGRDRTELDLKALDGALARLEREDERAARVVELLFFGGLAQREIAEVLGVGLRTVQGDWAYARAWLLRALDSESPGRTPRPGSR